MARRPTINDLLEAASAPGAISRTHAPGCRSLYDMYESCLPGCETDAELRQRIKDRLAEEQAP